MPQDPQYQYQHHPSAGAPGVPTPGYYGGGYNNAYYGGGGGGGGGGNGYSNYIPSGNSPHSHGGSGTQSKTVCRMDCRYCSAVVCLRGMKAMLLADTTVELYSTDHPPGSVQLIEKDYTTSNCKCKIRDVACRVCGNIIGYHITQPCQQCLKAPNNGHFWMFHTEGVVGQERLSMDLGKLVHKLITLPRQQQQQQQQQQRQLRSSTGSNSNRVNGNNINNNPINERVTETATNRQTSVSRQQQQHRPYSSLASPIPSSIRTDSNVNVSESSSTSQISLASDVGSEVPLRTASAVLATLSIARFLQPMKWEQLPHPDLDIDLDPSTMGGEPLFAEQWTEMVMKTAEAAAANMSLALDQEEETERFLEKMMEEKNLELEDSDIDDAEESDDDSFFEVDRQDVVAARENQGETMEQLIDQVDEFSLTSPLPGAEDRKDEDCHDSYMDDNRNDWRGTRASTRRQQESQPSIAPAPGQQGPSSLSSVSITPAPAMSSNRERSRRRGSATSTETSNSSSLEICPAFALNSATIAKASASAAAADAASAANNLLYGRRIRRDYDMMCR